MKKSICLINEDKRRESLMKSKETACYNIDGFRNDDHFQKSRLNLKFKKIKKKFSSKCSDVFC